MSTTEARLTASDLNKVITPEIKNDEFYELIKRLAAEEKLDTVLEIGSSAGAGSTEAFVKGLARNAGSPKLFCIEISKPRFAVLRDALAGYPFVHCYNRSSVRVDEFPAPQDVIRFYDEIDSGLRKFPIAQVLGWLQQDIDYVRGAGVEADAIETIKAEHGIDRFDMVLIDGSEFTGMAEFAKVDGARLILLDDTNTYKCFDVRRHLLARPDYELIADDQTLRNGFSAFRRRAGARTPPVLPIHFFTIVLNGEPFIRYHAEAFSRLGIPWHWHVVEGVAALKHDTAWSVAAGGHVADSVHDRGRSNDGTTDYLDALAARYPENVTIYRKPPDTFWDGKREMVAAPLPNIEEECLLWQVDADELWTPEQIATVHRMFTEAPERSAAMYWCWYFVGPRKIISTRYNYAQNPNQEWLRTWRYKPGDRWFAHEPPILVRDAGGDVPVDVAKIAPFGHDEMERAGVVFQHFAYAIEPQLAFKELYYGYKDARAQWAKLQAQSGAGLLRDYLAWVPDETMFDGVENFCVEPIAKPGPTSGQWCFSEDGVLPAETRKAAVSRPRIIVDGIFWQYHKSGIGRVWINLLRQWVETGFIENVVVLDRAGTAPRIAGVHYWTMARHDYRETGRDSLELERICRLLDADLFVSTYYSTPTTTPSVFMGYDMIPERLGFDISRDEGFHEKRRAIRHASGHIMISRNSAADLEAFHAEVGVGRTVVAHCAADARFTQPTVEEVERFRAAHDLAERPYVVMLGDRLGYQGYKNGALAFIAMERLQAERPVTLLCVGGPDPVEPSLTRLAPSTDIRQVRLPDDELRAALGGAHALVYPSRYEGFGMPPLEAMACGCPAIVCRNSSLPEVVGEAGLFVGETDPSSLTDLLVELFDPTFRQLSIEAGLERARQFSFARMAETIREALLAIHRQQEPATAANARLAWKELRELQRFHSNAARTVVAPMPDQPAAPNVAPPVVDCTEELVLQPVALAPVAIPPEDGELVHGSFAWFRQHYKDAIWQRDQAHARIAEMERSIFWRARNWFSKQRKSGGD